MGAPSRMGFAVAWIVLWALPHPGGASEPEGRLLKGVDAFAFLSPAEISARGIAPSGAFMLTPEGALRMGVPGNIYDVAAARKLLSKDAPGLSGFAPALGGIVAVVGDRLGFVRDGAFKPAVKLPATGLSVVAAADGSALYLHGAGSRAIFRYRKGGEYEKVIEADAPVSALTESGGRLFFAVGGNLYTVKDRETPTLIYSMSDVTFGSLAYDAVRRIVYFSAGDAVYALLGSAGVLVADRLCGHLLFQDGALWILDARKPGVFILSGIRDEPAVAPVSPGDLKE